MCIDNLYYYRSDVANLNMDNPKFHLIQTFSGRCLSHLQYAKNLFEWLLTSKKNQSSQTSEIITARIRRMGKVVFSVCMFCVSFHTSCGFLQEDCLVCWKIHGLTIKPSRSDYVMSMYSGYNKWPPASDSHFFHRSTVTFTTHFPQSEW